MKANEAPEKIYFEVNNNLIGLYDSAILGMFSVKRNKTAIEYIRTDAFIEKALNFMEMLGCGFTITDNITHTNYCKEQLIEDFRKYMKGE